MRPSDRRHEEQFVTAEYINELEAEMMEAADQLEFEKAAAIRDRIMQLQEFHGSETEPGEGRVVQTPHPSGPEAEAAERETEESEQTPRVAGGHPLPYESRRQTTVNYLAGSAAGAAGAELSGGSRQQERSGSAAGAAGGFGRFLLRTTGNGKRAQAQQYQANSKLLHRKSSQKPVTLTLVVEYRPNPASLHLLRSAIGTVYSQTYVRCCSSPGSAKKHPAGIKRELSRFTFARAGLRDG